MVGQVFATRRGWVAAFRAAALGAGLIASASALADGFTVGGGLSNLQGYGLELQLSNTTACISPGQTSSVYDSPGPGGPNACLTAATNACCSNASSNSQIVNNPDGTISCTVTCGNLPPIINAIHGAVQSAAPQTTSPAPGGTSYAFPARLSDGSSYSISVITQPTFPTQTCSVSNAAGTVSGANVTNADVSCVTATHTVTATAGPNGSVSPTSKSVDDEAKATITLAPATGYQGTASGCAGFLASDGVTYTTGPVTSDCTVTATFTPIPKSPTTTTLAIAPNPTMVGQGVTASVTVTSQLNVIGRTPPRVSAQPAVAPAPTGTVVVSGGGQTCSAPLTNGAGSCTLLYMTPGTVSVTAAYPGDTQNLASSATSSLLVAALPPVPAPGLGALAMLALVTLLCALAWRHRRTTRHAPHR